MDFTLHQDPSDAGQAVDELPRQPDQSQPARLVTGRRVDVKEAQSTVLNDVPRSATH